MSNILGQAKNLLSGRSPNEDKPANPDNRVDRIDQCKVLWYQWANELKTDRNGGFQIAGLSDFTATDEKLAKARCYDISNHIENFTYSKSMNGAAGSFSFTLHNSFDWPRFMRPGQWVSIYLTGDGDLPLPVERQVNGATSSEPSFPNPFLPIDDTVTPINQLPLPQGPSPEQAEAYKKRLRCVGIIQRVGIRSQTNIDGVVETSYVISGKDFGAVYEDTEIWFNANNADSAAYEAALKSINTQFSRNLSQLLDKWHDIFINPSSILTQGLTNVSAYFPKQWILPDQLVSDLNLSTTGFEPAYFGNIAGLKDFQPTVFENPDPNLMSGLEGRCWDRLKNCAQPEFHELFTELSDSGNPKIIFRPIPWAQDKSAYPSLGKTMLTYAELASGLPVAASSAANTVEEAIKSFTDIGALTAAAPTLLNLKVTDSRIEHAVNCSAREVEGYDIGPDFHSRTNFFLVDVMRSSLDQTNSFATLAKQVKKPYPFRDENDIKRHGFKPMFINLQTFNFHNKAIFAGSPYGNSAPAAFLIECNEILRDFYSNAEDYYSGTITLTAAKNNVKLGKVLLTDSTFQGISDMIFYIEGYSDSFSVSGDNGVSTWNQNLTVTRGIQKDVLNGASTKDRQTTQTSTFHAFNKDAQPGDETTLGKIKNFVKKPF